MNDHDDDLIERLRRYAPTLDAAIEAPAGRLGEREAVARRRRGAVAASIVAGIAGLAVARAGDDDRAVGSVAEATTTTVAPVDSGPDGSAPAESSALPPTTFDVSDLHRPPFMTIDDSSAVPVEVTWYVGDANAGEIGYGITYLGIDGADGAVRLEVGNTLGAAQQPDGESETVDSAAAPALFQTQETQDGEVVPTASFLLAGGGLTSERVLALSDRVVEIDDADWSDLVAAVQLDPLRAEMQAWRDQRIAAGFPPVQIVVAYG